MKILFRDHQQKAFKELTDIIVFLAKINGEEATDAIVSIFKVAEIIGVKEDLCKQNTSTDEKDIQSYNKWTDFFCLEKAIERHAHLIFKPGVKKW